MLSAHNTRDIAKIGPEPTQNCLPSGIYKVIRDKKERGGTL